MLRPLNVIYFALFVVLVFIVLRIFNNTTSNMNFIEQVDWKGDIKKQLIGAYIYSPDVQKIADALFIKEESLPKKHRIIKPGYMVTMDYDPERLNVYIRDDYYIRDVKFG